LGWGGVLKQSARCGDLCFGPPRGRNVTFVRPDRWLRRTVRANPSEAGRDFVRRFLAAYGPVSAADFGRWIEEPTKAKAVLRASADEPPDCMGRVYGQQGPGRAGASRRRTCRRDLVARAPRRDDPGEGRAVQALRPKVRKELVDEVERLAEFLGGSPRLSLAA